MQERLGSGTHFSPEFASFFILSWVLAKIKFKVGSCMVSYKNISWLCRILCTLMGWKFIFPGSPQKIPPCPKELWGLLALPSPLTRAPSGDVPIPGANRSLPCLLCPQAQSVLFALKTNKAGCSVKPPIYMKHILWFQAGSAMSLWLTYRALLRSPPQLNLPSASPKPNAIEIHEKIALPSTDFGTDPFDEFRSLVPYCYNCPQYQIHLESDQTKDISQLPAIFSYY